MIIYNVTVSIDKAVEVEWLDWMKSTHIPDVINTGLFSQCKVSRVLAEEMGGLTYTIAYSCKNMEEYNLYKEKHAAKLQEEHSKKFAGKFAAFRTLLEIVHTHE
ncbi:MAG: DUF4286 family protein [Bacteroidota bacterium]|nr:DUF4286 family protein [Bacteroidota bacterium]